MKQRDNECPTGKWERCFSGVVLVELFVCELGT